MPEIKHTPGPWLFGLHRYNDDSNQYEVLVKPFDYSGPGYYDNPSILAADGTEIVGCDEYQVFGSPADRQLLCAAPDILEALERLAEWGQRTIGPWQVEYTGDHPLAAARAAIAKATQPLNPA
jgi:hypothetical protein